MLLLHTIIIIALLFILFTYTNFLISLIIMNNNEYNIKYICIYRENLHFISHVYKYTAFYNYFIYIAC